MDRRHRLLSLSPALLAVLALGAVAGSQTTAAPASARVVANAPQERAVPTPTPYQQPKPYRDAYRKGYAEAEGNCAKAKSFSYDESADWDRKGWVDGYNAGHTDLCEGTG
ncbi:hypothetical protein AB0395_02905 [Streptosporangium sp. NPDC051023]|uniref:hypothetical protein n=1 Tax=Streptosporangium sp. NPDC051023 TaxID=3155410 RepID=UPI00344F7299